MKHCTDTDSEVALRIGLPETYRVEAAILFYDVFRNQLRAVMPTEEFARDHLPDDLDADRVIVALAGDKLAGFVGLAYGRRNFMTFGYRDFRDRFGLIGGAMRFFLYTTCTRPRLDRDLVVDGLGVTESMRRRGIGMLLINAVCDFARENGFRAVRLEVAESNNQARRLYERAGFTVVRTRTLPAFMAANADYSIDVEMCKSIS